MNDRIERALEPPKQDVMRVAGLRLRAADEDEGPGDGLTLDGYAAVFNRETLIDSWEGRFKETIAPGSMKRSFRETTPRLQFDHGYHPLIGSIPIGQVKSVSEDSDPELAPDGGAHVIARLHNNWLVQPVRDAIESGSVNGMSFRFSVLREEWRDANGKKITDSGELSDLLRRSWLEDVPEDELLVRTLKELKVPELGPVVWPAYSDTSVGVRSKITIDLGNLNDPNERGLLARAVFLADAASRKAEDLAPPAQGPTASDAVGTRPEEDATDSQRTAADSAAAGAHQPESSESRPDVHRRLDAFTRMALRTVANVKPMGDKR